MFNVLDLKTGNKFQITENFVSKNTYNKMHPILLHKGLVVSLVSYTVNAYGKRLLFKVIRAKPVIRAEYTNVPENAYINSYYKSGFVAVRLRKNDAERFIEEGNFRSYDNDYKQLTAYGQ